MEPLESSGEAGWCGLQSPTPEMVPRGRLRIVYPSLKPSVFKTSRPAADLETKPRQLIQIPCTGLASRSQQEMTILSSFTARVTRAAQSLVKEKDPTAMGTSQMDPPPKGPSLNQSKSSPTERQSPTHPDPRLPERWASSSLPPEMRSSLLPQAAQPSPSGGFLPPPPLSPKSASWA